MVRLSSLASKVVYVDGVSKNCRGTASIARRKICCGLYSGLDGGAILRSSNIVSKAWHRRRRLVVDGGLGHEHPDPNTQELNVESPPTSD